MDNPLIPTVKYATLITEGDGVKTAWEFNFAGGYISPEHVKAFTEDMVSGELVIRPLTLIGPNTAQITPAVADGLRLFIYRDTPKTEPLVDYSTGAILNESSLDKSNKQAVFIAAELADRVIADYDFSNALLYAVTTATAAAATANAIDSKAQQALDNSVAAMGTSANAVATAVSALTVANASGAAAQSAIDGVAAINATRRTFKYWGAVGDGVADDSPAIIAAITSGTKYIATDREAKYRMTQRGTVPSGVTIDNTSGAEFVWDGPATSTDIDGPFITSGLKVRFIKPVFTNVSANDNVAGVVAVASQGLRLIEPIAVGCTVLRTAAPAGVPYSGVITSGPGMNVCFDTVVTSPDTTGRGNNRHAASVDLYFAKSWAVLGGRSLDVKFGVQFWGGNAAIIGGDGVEANERKCSQGLAVGFHAVNGMAGVWGSMGQGIEVVGCYVDTMYDVGIDFEGCIDCGAVGNNVRDCINGNFATFYFNRNVSFRGNTSYQGTARPHYRSYNSTQTVSNRNVTFSGNNCRSPTGIISTIDLGGGSIESFDASFNTLHNVRVVATANNLKFANIIGNTMSFDTVIVDGILNAAIFVGPVYGGGSGVITGNRIRSSVAQPAGCIGIGAYGVDPNTSGVYDLWDNVINGFPIDIATQHAGTSGSQRSFFNLFRNRMGAGNYQRLETGTLPSIVRLRDNTDSSGDYYPFIIPTTGSWDVGTRIKLRTPITGGYWEAICTVGGAPGTWKGIGAAAA